MEVMIKLITKIIISGIILVAVIIIVFFTAVNIGEPKEQKDNLLTISSEKIKPSEDWGNLKYAAQKSFEANEELADSAPKQTVVALWGIKDNQSIIIMQNENIINQNYEIAKQNNNIINQNINFLEVKEKTNKLLLYLIITILFFGATFAGILVWRK
jgi:hypothetical protein